VKVRKQYTCLKATNLHDFFCLITASKLRHCDANLPLTKVFNRLVYNNIYFWKVFLGRLDSPSLSANLYVKRCILLEYNVFCFYTASEVRQHFVGSGVENEKRCQITS